jgi:phytoene dehydrogenase-like protein
MPRAKSSAISVAGMSFRRAGWMTDATNTVIVGGGHNGLVCAAYLARAGRSVTVLEAADQVGGMAATREFAPGYKASCAHLVYLLDAEIQRELQLAENGLELAAADLATVALDADGDHLVIGANGATGAGLPTEEQAAYRDWRARMDRFAGILALLHNQVPPRIHRARTDLLALARLALRVRRLGREEMREFLRIAGINIHDLLEEQFTHPLLKGALSLDAVLGTFSGPRSNNSVFTALHRLSVNGGTPGSYAIPAGAMGGLTEALATAAVRAGADIRFASRVRRIVADGLNVSGVELDDGEFIAAGTVISNLDVKTTMLDLLGARNVEADVARRVRHVRSEGHAAKLHLALDGRPHFRGLSAAQHGDRLLISPSSEHVERAFNHCKYGEFSPEPVLEITLPSVHDPSLAPPGGHVLSAVVQYAPYTLAGGWTAGKDAFLDAILQALERYAPDIRQHIVATELLTPADIERLFGARGGHWHHAELALHQFLMLRPVPRWAQYRMPVGGLYLCGASCHPGGGVMGSAGRNAARTVLQDAGEAGR